MTLFPSNTGLRAYLALSPVIALVAKPLLRRRIKRGKEDPRRWREKCGVASCDRPQGRLVWLHAVGLGETLALRGLIAMMQTHDPALQFLITSTTWKSAQAIAHQMPPQTVHQYLPLDAPAYLRKFLDHWRPDIAIWTEQDIWPGMVAECATRNIPQAIVAGRLSASGTANRTILRGIYRTIYRTMAFIAVQDTASQTNFRKLADVESSVRGSLKPAAPALTCTVAEQISLQHRLANRLVWIAASTHPADEEIVIAAHARVLQSTPDALLIIAPRFSDRPLPDGPHIIRRTQHRAPDPDTRIWIADTTGEMGLFYALAQAAYIGGTNDTTQGHNPWEAINLGLPVLHGPCTENFTDDFARLGAHALATQITAPDQIATWLLTPRPQQQDALIQLKAQIKADIDLLATDLLSLVRTP